MLYSAASLAGYCAGPESERLTAKELSRYAAVTADSMLDQFYLRFKGEE